MRRFAKLCTRLCSLGLLLHCTMREIPKDTKSILIPMNQDASGSLNHFAASLYL